MCGIVGAIARRDITPILIDGLKRLEYRGYDSAGIAIRKPGGELCRIRSVGKVAARGNWVGDNELIADAGMHLDEQDLRGGEAHVSTRVKIYK